MNEVRPFISVQRVIEQARARGVQTQYWTADGELMTASDEALAAVLEALGPASEPRAVEPCYVAWDGAFEVPVEGATIVLESGAEHRGGALPLGYHTLVAGELSSHIIAAPSMCFAGRRKRRWGAFAPLYGLRSARSDAAGGADFGDLAAAIEAVTALGGSLVGTLPLLAAFLSTPFDPSPYAPVSRRHWNELFLDVGRVAGAAAVDAARAAEVAALHEVDYQALATLRRAALEPAVAARRDQVAAYRAAHPEVDDYAVFRAVVEHRGESWHAWPLALREGTISEADYDPAVRDYHVLAQLETRAQLEALSTSAGGLYLDLPVGVHPDGYDAWRERGVFAPGVTVGAPPDALFDGGQDWAIPALHPERSRETGHRYFAECIREHMRYANVLRIDHVMGLHRRYWVPRGLGPKEGVYVRMPAEELVAVLTLESARARCEVVGEDLGTVEDSVREDMAARNMHRMFVAQFDLDGDVPAGCAASLNTHDTPTWAGFCELYDIDDVQTRRDAQLDKLARSDAWLVLVAMEDLWLETRAQNKPGTTSHERANWRGKLRYAIDDWNEWVGLLEKVAVGRRARRRKK